MPEELLEEPVSQASPKLAAGKKQSKWRKKIPPEVLNSPGGTILIVMAGIMELIDLVPIPFLDQLWELPLEIIFMIFLANIAKLPFQSLIIPFVIERIPIVNDILPTWIIRLFM
ncbi:MAG: hypothetical protein AAB451_00010 [Patescibacteria group bacterium]